MRVDADVLVVAGYGLVSFAGGLIGFLKVRSTPSLIAGGLAGIGLLGCAYGLEQAEPVVTWAAFGSIVIALLLGLRFLTTWRRRPRLFPDLIMVYLSAFALLTVSIHWIATRP